MGVWVYGRWRPSVTITELYAPISHTPTLPHPIHPHACSQSGRRAQIFTPAHSHTPIPPYSHTSSTSTPLDIFISAGDASGDAHGAEVVEALRKLEPSVQVSGIGGPRLVRAGVETCFDSSDWSVIGPLEAARLIPSLWLKFQTVKRILRSEPPDVVVPIDFGGFNVRLAWFARRCGIPVLYYFPPRSWARQGKSVLEIARVATKVATPFPWSAERLRAAGADVEFVGHPVIDRAQASAEPMQLRKEFGIPPAARVVAIFPGSRKPEIRHILPVILQACEEVWEERADTFFVLSRAVNLSDATYTRALNRSKVKPRMVAGRVYDLMSIAEVGITVSGTVTLEAACMGMPMVIVYTGPWLGRTLWKLLMNLPMVGMPNILLDQMIVPELIGDRLSANALRDQTLRLLKEPAEREAMRQALLTVRPMLGPGGAAQRTAEMILELARTKGQAFE